MSDQAFPSSGRSTLDFIIRPDARTDHEAIIEFSLRAWAPVFESCRSTLGHELYERVYPQWQASQANAIRDALNANDTWVATVDHRPCGFVNVTFNSDEPTGDIHMIAVDPDTQRTGIGLALTDHALAEMKARGMSLATVSTGGDPGHGPARRTYEKAGFTAFPLVWYSKLIQPAHEGST